MSLSFQKLNSKCQKSGSDLRKSLLVFTVITACRSQKQRGQQAKQRKGKRKLESEGEASPAKQQLCSFESAFCSISSKDELDDCTESSSDLTFPTQVPLNSFSFLCCNKLATNVSDESEDNVPGTEELLRELCCYSTSEDRTITAIPQYLPVAAY